MVFRLLKISFLYNIKLFLPKVMHSLKIDLSLLFLFPFSASTSSTSIPESAWKDIIKLTPGKAHFRMLFRSHPSKQQLKMASKLKLVYFPIAGRGESIRLALHVGGIAFDDHRITFADWPALKPKTPFGAIPILEIEGHSFGQSNALLRYAGKLGGLYPSDPLAALRVDEILDAVEDVTSLITPSLRETDPEKRAALRKVLAETSLPPQFANLEKALARNKASPFVTGKDLTVGDLKLAPVLGWIQSGVLDGIPADLADSHPHLVALRNAVFHHPKVQEWNAAHPK